MRNRAIGWAIERLLGNESKARVGDAGPHGLFIEPQLPESHVGRTLRTLRTRGFCKQNPSKISINLSTSRMPGLTSSHTDSV